MKKLLLTCLLALTALSASAADVTALGSWSENIDAADLLAGAGSSLLNPESVSGVTTISINALLTWSLRARVSGGNWDNSVGLWIKRSSNGSGLGTISGGTSYVQLTGTDTEICSGLLARSGISLQFRVSGLSPNLGPGTYQAPIVFTIVAL